MDTRKTFDLLKMFVLAGRGGCRPGLWIRTAIVATLVGQAGHAAASHQLRVVTDRPNAIYTTDEEARFLITLTKDGQPVSSGELSYMVDDFVTADSVKGKYPKGKLTLGDEAAVVSVHPSGPGFVRCRVMFHPPENDVVRGVAAAGFSPEKIMPSLPVPEDFDSFWADQKQQLADVPLDPKLTPVPHDNTNIECFDVQVACLGGAPVSGYLAKPKHAGPKSLPAILWVHGAGVRGSVLANAVRGAEAGMLSMDINAHGIANGRPAEHYRELGTGQLKDYRYAGRDGRETSYFRGMFLRLVRAIDFLTAQPEWDGNVVAVIGHSQGGGQALAAGGLDQRVTFIAAGVPAICDHSGRVAGRINGWPKLVPDGPDGQPDAKILQASRYVDAVNLASRCRADAIMSVGFIDRVCPPSSCYAAYNSLLGNKHVINEPSMGHAAPSHIQQAFFKRVLQHVRQKP